MGNLDRLAGQKRVPAPPAMMTACNIALTEFRGQGQLAHSTCVMGDFVNHPDWRNLGNRYARLLLACQAKPETCLAGWLEAV